MKVYKSVQNKGVDIPQKKQTNNPVEAQPCWFKSFRCLRINCTAFTAIEEIGYCTIIKHYLGVGIKTKCSFILIVCLVSVKHLLLLLYTNFSVTYSIVCYYTTQIVTCLYLLDFNALTSCVSSFPGNHEFCVRVDT